MPDEPIVVDEEVDEENPEVAVDETATDEETEVADETTTELSDEELKQAKGLFKLLKNPQTQKSTLKILAEQAGVLEKPAENKTELKQQKKDLKSILEEKLGPDLKWLVPKLGDAMEEILEQERGSLYSLQEQQKVDELVRATEKLNRETKGDFQRQESRMSQLADEILPAPGMSVEKYVRHLYSIASSERRGNQTQSKLVDRINRNASNASERVRGITSGSKEVDDKAKAGKLSLKEAVAFAAQKLDKK